MLGRDRSAGANRTGESVVFGIRASRPARVDRPTYGRSSSQGDEGTPTEAKSKVDAGQWVPLAAGGMDQGSLRRDGGFKESGNEGMLFADVSKSADEPMVVYFDLAGGEAASIVAGSLSDLLE